MTQAVKRHCKECGDRKEISLFYGERRVCKVCVLKKAKVTRDNQSDEDRAKKAEYMSSYGKEYYVKNKDQIDQRTLQHYHDNKELFSIQRKQYYEDNTESILAASKVYYENNKEKRAASAKLWRENNKEAIKDKSKVYLEQNKDAIKARQKLYVQNNKDIVNAQSAKRRAARLQRTVAWANLEAIKQVYADCEEINLVAKTAGCTEKSVVDHYIPMQGDNVSGLHVEYNLQIITQKANCEKSNSFDLEAYNAT